MAAGRAERYTLCNLSDLRIDVSYPLARHYNLKSAGDNLQVRWTATHTHVANTRNPNFMEVLYLMPFPTILLLTLASRKAERCP